MINIAGDGLLHNDLSKLVVTIHENLVTCCVPTWPRSTSVVRRETWRRKDHGGRVRAGAGSSLASVMSNVLGRSSIGGSGDKRQGTLGLENLFHLRMHNMLGFPRSRGLKTDGLGVAAQLFVRRKGRSRVPDIPAPFIYAKPPATSSKPNDSDAGGIEKAPTSRPLLFGELDQLGPQSNRRVSRGKVAPGLSRV